MRIGAIGRDETLVRESAFGAAQGKEEHSCMPLLPLSSHGVLSDHLNGGLFYLIEGGDGFGVRFIGALRHDQIG